MAARREVLLKNHEPHAWKEPQLKAVGCELRQWVKRVRQPFGNLEGANINAAVEDDGASPLSHMVAQLVKRNTPAKTQPIKTPPNRKASKRSRIPTPVVTPAPRWKHLCQGYRNYHRNNLLPWTNSWKQANEKPKNSYTRVIEP